ncbi:ribose transport system permease protein RbsC [Citreicella sp. SE45]|uniref:Mannose ABC transporter membrane protein/fructose ABC transporter membrane protein/ribose ABC transporter membrane protein n=1 Tax=Salipiger thiooxidans TaxID=282683 RepID=A0A1G7IUD4_9RHOB|nr:MULTISPECIES: ABC transporter permease [Salipiger]EEX14770.1 ribose transport system permease protein RbsC [Citreicella sp. SE45]NIY97519.1 ABC transporter permease [Salipiger sp. HF18]NVK59227.1 ABC transporter permease [Paracoccaceae bacterium]SDF16352.1 mannose ABC transporter membrane protein/fructose ABC transporter membrane protein/ribose ABC transporter membrane protein [Salipiger thiooxidans]
MSETIPPTRRSAQDFETAVDSADRRVAAFDPHRRGPVEKLQHVLHSNPTLVPVIVLLGAVAVFGVVSGSKFFSAFNLTLIMQQVSIIGILAAAQSLIVLTAGIDLSVAAIMVLMSVIAGNLAVYSGVPAFLALIIAFVGGTAAGMFNGFLVTRVKLPPFITTLGTWSIFYALNLWLSGAQSIRSQDIDSAAPLLKVFGETIAIGPARITYGSILMVLVFLVLWYMLNRTAWGRHVYAVGDDAEAAELAGIRTGRTLMSVYALAGFVCGIAAWASIGRVGSISPQAFYEGNLQSITAVVIGGISLFGGRGSILGALFGALIVGVFQSGLRLAGVDVLWQVFAIGWLIIIAVAIDQWIRKVSA